MVTTDSKLLLIITQKRVTLTDRGRRRGRGDLHRGVAGRDLRLRAWLGQDCRLREGDWRQGRAGAAAQHGGLAHADGAAGLGEVLEEVWVAVLRQVDSAAKTRARGLARGLVSVHGKKAFTHMLPPETHKQQRVNTHLGSEDLQTKCIKSSF